MPTHGQHAGHQFLHLFEVGRKLAGMVWRFGLALRRRFVAAFL
jgi:hypothetical protein